MDTCYNQSARHTPTINANVFVYAALALLASIGVFSYAAHQPGVTASAHHSVLLAPAQFPPSA
jgi:hypothetical protein